MGALLVIWFVLYMARRSGGAAGRAITGEYQREATAYRQQLERDHPDWTPWRRNRVAAARAFGAAASDLRHLAPAVTRAARRGWSEARDEWGTTREDHEAWRARHRDEVAERRDQRRQRRQRRRWRGWRAVRRGRASGAASPAPEPAGPGAGAAPVITLPRRRRRRPGSGWDEAPAVGPGPAASSAGPPAPVPAPVDPAPVDPAPATPAPATPAPADPAPATPAPATPAPGSPAGPAPQDGRRSGPDVSQPGSPPGTAPTAASAPGTSPAANPTGDSSMTTPTGETTRYEQTNAALGSFSGAAGETLAAAEAVALPVVAQARAIAAAADQLEASITATGMTDQELTGDISTMRSTAADLAAAADEFERMRMRVMDLAMALDAQARSTQDGHVTRHGRIVEAVSAAGGAARDTTYYENN